MTEPNFEKKKVEIRLFQKYPGKYRTNVEGLQLPPDQFVNIVRKIKFATKCKGVIIKNMLQFSGDQRDFIQQFLVENNICELDEITKHEF